VRDDRDAEPAAVKTFLAEVQARQRPNRVFGWPLSDFRAIVDVDCALVSLLEALMRNRPPLAALADPVASFGDNVALQGRDHLAAGGPFRPHGAHPGLLRGFARSDFFMRRRENVCGCGTFDTGIIGTARSPAWARMSSPVSVRRGQPV
jgi:hypothetical protein